MLNQVQALLLLALAAVAWGRGGAPPTPPHLRAAIADTLSL
jgi:hypothetical protein